MARKYINEIEIANAELMARNFVGKPSANNPNGERNFCVYIPEENVEDMINDGWNVKPCRIEEADGSHRHYLPVAVRFDKFPPLIKLISGKTKTYLDDETVGQLDRANIVKIDLVISPKIYFDKNDVNHEYPHIKAYTSEMYVTVHRSSFADKYADEESPEDDDDSLPFC